MTTEEYYYTLNDSFQRDTMIEGFQSMIWTQRYSAAGDFQLITPSTIVNRSLLQPETWIGRSNSKYTMKIDTVSDETDDTGIRLMTVTGSSMEAVLQDRVAFGAIADLTSTPTWTITDKPADVVRTIFQQICVACILDPLDAIPFYTAGTLLPEGNLGEPTDVITVSVTPDTLYNTVKSICDTYSLGFRLIRNGDLKQIYFEVYVGSNLTTGQTIKNPVIFDPNMENLESIKVLTSSALRKTIAYVFALHGAVKVYDPVADTSATGADRRILMINSSNQMTAGAGLTTALTQEGLLALAAQRDVYGFDGQLPPDVQFVYGTDYGLGDLVEERIGDGISNYMLVTEVIFVTDDQGDRSYPTLSLYQVVTPGSWSAFGNAAWNDVATTVHWADLT